MQFWGAKIFYRSIGKNKLISFARKWKGEIMGINSNYSIYGFKDYAADFREKTKESSIRIDQMLKDAGIRQTTVPVGQSDVKNENKGLTVEHNPKDVEQNVPEQAEQETQELELGNLGIKSERKAAEEKVKEAYLKNGLANGDKITDEKEAEKMAKAYVKNEYYKQNSEKTTVFIGKDEYKAAEEQRNQKYDKLYEQYREQGYKRRIAKEKANAELGINEYVKKKQTRDFVENHEDMFYDEKGNFSSDKFKDQAVNFANTHTRSDEVENQYLSLKERREVAAKNGVKPAVIRDIADKSNIGYEKDYTPLMRVGLIAGTTALGAVGGYYLLGASATATAGSGAIVGAGAASGAGATTAASASASVSGTLPGAAAGLGVGAGLTPLIYDRGNKEPRIYEPGKPECNNCEFTTGQDTVVKTKTEEVNVPIEYCSYKVNKDDLWYGIVSAKYRHEDGTPLTQKEMREVWQGLKKMHNIPLNLTYIPLKELRLYSEINGKKYCVDCDAKVTTKNKNNYATPSKRWQGTDPGILTRSETKQTQESKTNYYYTDCDGNRSQNFSNAAERDEAMKKAQDALNALLQK